MNNLNVERSGAGKNYMFSDSGKGRGSDDVKVVGRPDNLQPRDNRDNRPQSRQPNLNESHFDGNRSHQRPNLTSSSGTKKGYVPMEGLDLLTNPGKFDREEYSGGRDSVKQPDDDDDNDDNDDNDTFLGQSSNPSSGNPSSGHPSGGPPSSGHKNSDGSGSESESESRSDSDSHSARKHSSSDDSESENRKMSYEQIQLEKQKFLYILNRLEKAGYVPTRKYTMASNYDDIKYEVTRLKRERDIDKSIKFQRKLLMAFTSGVEFINNKFDPIGAKLDDWSEHVMENIGDYDEVFEELHDKYGDKIEVAPEIKFVMMVSGSAFMYHLTQTLFKSATPGLQDILRNNPDIMRNISQAALSGMGRNDPEMQGAFNFMGQGLNMGGRPSSGGSGGSGGRGGGGSGGSGGSGGRGDGGRGGGRGGGDGGRGGEDGMNGPVGVDDILNELEAEASMEGARVNERQRRRAGAKDAINIDV